MESSGTVHAQATTAKGKVEKRAGKQRLPFKECMGEGLLGRDSKTAARTEKHSRLVSAVGSDNGLEAWVKLQSQDSARPEGRCELGLSKLC